MKHFQLVVFRKLSGWNLEKWYIKSIHVASASTKDLLETRLEKRIGFLACSTTRRTSCATIWKFPIEPTNPSRDRSGQPVVGAHTRTVQDGRKTSRSQEIDVNSFHEETVSSDRSGQPVVETSKTQTRSSDDIQSLNVELAHNRSGQPVVETNTENVPDGCETRSCHESVRLNVEDETLRERSGQPVVNHDDSSHEQTMLNEVNMDFRIPTFCCEACAEYKRSRISSENWEPPKPTCSSTRSTTKPSLQSVQSGIQNRWFRKWATWSCVNCSRRTPRRSAKHAYLTGVKASPVAQAGIS